MYWAKASVDAGKLVNEDFKYAALLPFGGNLIFQPFVAMFGLSMATQIASMCVFTVLLMVGLVLFFRSFGYSMNFAYIGTALFFICMSASVKLREIMWQHIIYYSLGILLFLYLTAAVNYAMKAVDEAENIKNVKMWVTIILTFIVGFLCGGNGMQIILLSMFPVIMGVAGRVYLKNTSMGFKENKSIYIMLAVLACATVVGLIGLKVVSHGVTAGYQNAYSTYSDMDNWADNLLKFPNQWYSLLGVDIKGGEPLISLASVMVMLRIFYGLVLLIMPFVLLFRYNHLESDSLKFMVIAHLGMSAFVLFGYIFGKLSAANWRLTPVYATAFLTCFMYAKERIGSLAKLAYPLLAMIMGFSIVVLVDVYAIPSNSKEDNVNYKLAQTLKEHELTKGYATFWHAGSVTVFSDGYTQSVSVTIDDKGVSPYYYQNERVWFEDVDGQDKYYLILSKGELSTIEKSASKWPDVLSGAIEIIECEGYKIYVFDSNLPFE